MDLRANTAVDVLIGPFVDSTDGDTEETALTISQADVTLSKNGQALAQKNDATACAHDAKGMYNCELDATDLNTEGTLVLTVHESGALYVRHEFNVMAEAAWDSLYVAKDTGFMDVNVKAVSEDTTAADNLESACDNYSATRGLSGTALPAAAADAAGGLIISDLGGLDADQIATDSATAARATTLAQGTIGGVGNDTTHLHLDALTYGNDEINGQIILVFDNSESEYHVALITDWVLSSGLATVQGVGGGTLHFTPEASVDTFWLLPTSAGLLWDRVLTGNTHNVSNSAGRRLRQLDAAFEVHSGTSAGGGTSTTFVMDGGASSVDDIYNGDRIVITEGLGAGEHGIITDYDGGTVTATMSKAWTVTPDSTSVFSVVPADCDVETWNHNAVNGLGALADWDDGGRLDLILDAVLADVTGLNGDVMRGTDNANTTVPDAAGTAPTAVENRQEMDSNSTQLAAIVADTNELQGDWANGGRLDLLLDLCVAHAASTAEPGQGAPAATATRGAKIDYLYKAWRNRSNQTATTYQLYADDASTVDQKATVSDDATTFESGEIATGP